MSSGKVSRMREKMPSSVTVGSADGRSVRAVSARACRARGQPVLSTQRMPFRTSLSIRFRQSLSDPPLGE